MPPNLLDFNDLPRTFATGCPCLTKGGLVPVVIKEALGSKQWKVMKIDENGEETGITWEKKSQQLRRVKKNESHPLIRRSIIAPSPLHK